MKTKSKIEPKVLMEIMGTGVNNHVYHLSAVQLPKHITLGNFSKTRFLKIADSVRIQNLQLYNCIKGELYATHVVVSMWVMEHPEKEIYIEAVNLRTLDTVTFTINQ